MCTVVFLPRKTGFAMASVRDESPFRETQAPQVVQSGDTSLLCPIDLKSGGTWLGINGFGIAVVLLNGAFINHLPNTRSYGTSRGTIVKALLHSGQPARELETILLTDVEPFTLVVRDENQLLEFRWDGKEKYFRRFDTKTPRIWSSSTLYSREIQQKRQRLFHEWLEESPCFDLPALTSFFQRYQDASNGFFMKRADNLCSVSLSFLETGSDSTVFTYQNLLSGSVSTITLP